MRNDTHEVHIGPRIGDGEQIEIVRRFQSTEDPHDPMTVIRYVCHNVVDIDVDDPWMMGTSEPGSQIGLDFSSGRTEYVTGVIVDVGCFDDDV